MSKKPDSKSGRVSYDDRGQPVWEWRVDTGVFSCDIDTAQVRQIQEDVDVTLQEEPVIPAGFDPYGTLGSAEPPKKARRTLDDMRKLSEEIKRKRQEQK